MSRRTAPLAVGLAMLAGAALAAPASAISDPLTVSASPSRLEFLGPAAPQEVIVTLEGGSRPGEVLLEANDALITPGGDWQDAEFGTTPGTLQGAMTIEPAGYRYDPAEGRRSFRFLVTVDAALVSEPRYGSLSAFLQPDAPADGGGGILTTAGVELRVIAAPIAADLEDLPSTDLAIAIEEFALRQRQPWTPVDAVFPDLPVLVNHGPIAVGVRIRNAGATVLDARVRYEFFRLTPLAAFGFGSEGAPVYTVTNAPSFLFPGEVSRDETTSLIAGDGLSEVDALPLVGFVRIRATAIGSLSGVEAEPVTISRTFLVFPWKESLFLFVVWLFQREWRHRKGRKVKLGEDGTPIVSARTRIRERLGKLLGRGAPER